MQHAPNNPPPVTPLPPPAPGKNPVIVPAYNESASVAHVVNDLHKHLPRADVLIVDDGSTDGTHQAVPDHTPVLRLPFNLGIGAAMQAGYRYASIHNYDFALQVDGDGQHPADQAHKLISALVETHADLVIGSRFLPDNTGDTNNTHDPNYKPPATRAAGIGVIRAFVRLLTGLRITDCTSGFRACNRGVIQAFARWYPEDYPEPQVIPLLHRAGFTIHETPVTMRPRTTGQTSIPFLKGVFYILKVGFALLLDLSRSPWPKKKANQP